MRQEYDLSQNKYDGISLLWKDTANKAYYTLSDEDIADLNIETLSKYMSDEFKVQVQEHLAQVPLHIEDTLYRQQVVLDLCKNKDLYTTLFAYGEEGNRLMKLSKFAFEKEATVYNLIKRMDEVETIKKMVEELLQVFSRAKPSSEGLRKYQELLEQIVNSKIYEAFTKDVQYIKSLEEGVKSLKIGINLNEYLQPEEAILLEISDEEFNYGRFSKKLGYYVSATVNEIKTIPRKIFARETVMPPDALNTLEKTLEPATMQLISFCDQFTMKILEVISVLHHELPYYRIAVEAYQLLVEKKLPCSMPVWGADFHLHGMYHMDLGLRKPKEIVFNNFEIGEDKKILILTGVNRGGKTTISQALGQCIWFAQLGFYVPASTMSLTYISKILIHFPKEEDESVSYGRLGEECERFRKLFDEADANSFFLMNESFSGTTHHESLQISIETLRGIEKKGAYVLFNTHLHELYEQLCEVANGKGIESYIAGANMKESPYLVEKGRPLGKSHAREIANRYGMSFEKLMEAYAPK
jgi:DNA mismatch repair protein MutS